MDAQAACCVVQLNTAAFEYFREDLIERINNCYGVLRHDQVRDVTGCITGEIIRVGSINEITAKSFTVNIYQTTSRVMINGSKFQNFVDNDLPN